MRQAGEKRAEGPARGGGGGGGAGVRGVLAAVTARGGRRREHEGEVARRPVRAAVPGDRVGGTRREARVGERGGSRAQGKAQFARQLRVRARRPERGSRKVSFACWSARAASRTRAKSASDATNARRSARGEGDTVRGMSKAHAMRARVCGGRSPRRLLCLSVGRAEKKTPQTTLRELLGSILKKPSRARRWRKSPGAR